MTEEQIKLHREVIANLRAAADAMESKLPKVEPEIDFLQVWYETTPRVFGVSILRQLMADNRFEVRDSLDWFKQVYVFEDKNILVVRKDGSGLGLDPDPQKWPPLMVIFRPS